MKSAGSSSFPLFDKRKAFVKLVAFKMHTLERHAIFDREWQSFSVSLIFFLFPFPSRAEDAISFNFLAMCMKYEALRGFEGANAANRYATSNSVSASESKQDNRRGGGRKGTNGVKEQRERKRKALYSCWKKKKPLESVKMTEQVGVRKYVPACIEKKQAHKSGERACGECGIFRGLVG